MVLIIMWLFFYMRTVYLLPPWPAESDKLVLFFAFLIFSLFEVKILTEKGVRVADAANSKQHPCCSME